MAGHNKWTQIKRQKAVVDAKKSKVFGKLARDIALASRDVKGDTNAPALRALIDRARAENMPKENIERAVMRGSGKGEGELVRVVYEAYGPGGAAMLMVGITDSTNRTSQEVKHILSEQGLALAAPGSASWAFKKEGETYTPTTTVPLSPEDTEKLEGVVALLEDHEDIEDVITNNQ